MNIVTLLPFIVLIGAMFLMTRSAKNKQRQAAQMRDQMQPGAGIRTIGGMYATVKEVHHDSVLLEVAPGIHAVYAKNSVGAVLEDAEYNRIVHGIEPETDLKVDAPVVPDDASSLAPGEDIPVTEEPRIDLGKSEAAAEPKAAEKAAEKAGPEGGKKNEGDADTK